MTFSDLALILILGTGLLMVWTIVLLAGRVRALIHEVEAYREEVNRLQRTRQNNLAGKVASTPIPRVDSKARVTNRPQSVRGAKQSMAVHREKTNGLDNND